ncbi:capreomycidine synthase [Saccharothrix tamanrassetensis]|uniref:Capreomycidine synthase n=1 Tax=Saccharothrix tamanrassetensis TaxID=1051531 RepID=A0A841CRX2_9PSEU|nr:capreomycidine synthase [Saccharothrix tamanrassetensis]MBB5959623.1 capreomycidine synthase [Saccharothrix tamanrassetensis]
MLFRPAPLEDWLRDYYFEASTDISSSGVEPYDFAQLRSLLGIEPEELDRVSFRDSPSAGSLELRSLIASRWGSGAASEVIVANGSTEAQLLVFASILGPGDEVVVVEPAYHSLISTVDALGCRVRRWHLRSEEQFQPDLEELRRLVTARTKMIVVNFPHNPTGVTLTHAEQRELVEIAQRYGSYLLWDGAFEDLVYDAPSLPAVSILYDRGISFGTLSKSYGLPGLRLGWAIGPSEIVKHCVTTRDYTTLALSPLVEFVARQVVASADRLLLPRLQVAARNREVVDEWMGAHQRVVSYARPAAGVVVFPRLRSIPDTIAFCHRLMREHGVLLVPGECFHHPGHVRLGFGGDSVDLARGLHAFSELLSESEGSS